MVLQKENAVMEGGCVIQSTIAKNFLRYLRWLQDHFWFVLQWSGQPHCFVGFGAYLTNTSTTEYYCQMRGHPSSFSKSTAYLFLQNKYQ